MRTLLLADIHANLPAFQSVLEHAGKWDRLVFLGDIANFGPHPSECVDLLRSLDPVCIMGNHDYLIAGAWAERNFFDEWSREQLTDRQLDWIKQFRDSIVLDDDMLAIHGAFNVSYDILPGIPDDRLEEAFRTNLSAGIKRVVFGHYHYQVDQTVHGVDYHCIRPVGHHRDRDVRAGYSILENGRLSHYRVEYDIERTIRDTETIGCLTEPLKTEWIQLLKNAYSESLLKKDAKTIAGYAQKAGEA